MQFCITVNGLSRGQVNHLFRSSLTRKCSLTTWELDTHKKFLQANIAFLTKLVNWCGIIHATVFIGLELTFHIDFVECGYVQEASTSSPNPGGTVATTAACCYWHPCVIIHSPACHRLRLGTTRGTMTTTGAHTTHLFKYWTHITQSNSYYCTTLCVLIKAYSKFTLLILVKLIGTLYFNYSFLSYKDFVVDNLCTGTYYLAFRLFVYLLLSLLLDLDQQNDLHQTGQAMIRGEEWCCYSGVEVSVSRGRPRTVSPASLGSGSYQWSQTEPQRSPWWWKLKIWKKNSS